MENLERRRLPSFFVVGPARTGSTWLHRVLTRHVGLPHGIKESNFFSTNHGRGFDWYYALFAGCPVTMPLGEICPEYFYHPAARERIATMIPGARITFTFRDPVERLYSHWKVLVHYGMTKASFAEAVADPDSPRHRKIFEASRYAHHFRSWREIFTHDRLLVMLYTDLKSDPQGYLDKFCDFVGAPRFRLDQTSAAKRVFALDRAPLSHHLAQNARHLRFRLMNRRAFRTVSLLERVGLWQLLAAGGKRFPPLDRKLEEQLRNHFEPEVDELEKMIGRDLSAWRSSRAERGRGATGSVA